MGGGGGRATIARPIEVSAAWIESRNLDKSARSMFNVAELFRVVSLGLKVKVTIGSLKNIEES